jgi:hypothetical protein
MFMSEIMLMWTSEFENINLSEMNFIACEVMFHIGYCLQVYLYATLESKALIIVHLAKKKKKC